MEINKLVKTCSMFELGEMNFENFELISKKKLLRYLDNNIEYNYDYSIIYNTNFNFFERLYLRVKFGFKTIGSYRGYKDRKVHILLLKVKN